MYFTNTKMVRELIKKNHSHNASLIVNESKENETSRPKRKHTDLHTRIHADPDPYYTLATLRYKRMLHSIHVDLSASNRSNR